MITTKSSKRERTRDAIAAAALDLFERQGYDHTTVDQIVQAANVSPRTFFRHFPRKEALLFGRGDELSCHLAESIGAANPTLSPAQALVDGLFRVASVAQADHEFFVRWHRVGSECAGAADAERHSVIDATVTRLGRIMADRMGLDIASDPRPTALVGSGAACLISSIRVWASGQGDSDLAVTLASALSCVGLPSAPSDA